MEGGMKCVKFMLLFFNFIFWLCGLALIIVGVLAKTASTTIPAISLVTSNASPIVVIIVGVVVFFIAFFGCCGAWKENYCMVTTFVVLLFLIIIIEIGIAIAAYVFKNKLEDAVKVTLKKAINDYTKDPNVKDIMDKTQHQLKCCGAANSSDWATIFKNNTVPDSCCRNQTKNCGNKAMGDSGKIFTEGCVKALEEFIKHNILWIGVAALVIAFIEILGIVFACILMRGIRQGYEVM